MKKLIILSLTLVTLYNCGSKKRVVTTKDRRTPKAVIDSRVTPSPSDTKPIPVGNIPESTQDYIAQYSAIAQEEMRLYDIPASITLAQGILESGSGRGRLATQANNHFGIKCHGWAGGKIYHDDDKRQECFRKYNNPKYSFRDHSLFLVNRKRYSKLFTYKKTDYKSWARGLKKAGYATDPRYPNKLISLIERYGLHQYDKGGKGKTQPTHSEGKTHRVSKGDTLYSISQRYNTTVERLKQLNGLGDNNISIGQELRIQ